MLEAQISVRISLEAGEEGRLEAGVEEGVEGRGGADGHQAAFAWAR